MAERKPTFGRYFITGLLAILPLWLTLSILWIAFNWISGITAPIFNPVFRVLFDRDLGRFLARISSFVLTIILIWIIGFLTTQIIGKRLLLWMESMLLKLPLLREIYQSIKKIVSYLFTEKKAFRKVVLVEFPRKGIYSIGFVTMDAKGEVQDKTIENVTHVFIPTTTNPTTGFLLLVPQQELIHLEMSIEEAMTLIISGGMISPDKRIMPQGKVHGPAGTGDSAS